MLQVRIFRYLLYALSYARLSWYPCDSSMDLLNCLDCH